MNDHARDPTRNFFHARVARANAGLARQSAAMLEAAVGLTNRQWLILRELAVNGMKTAADVARETGVDKALVSRNLRLLETMGLIAWRPDPADGRAKILSLTEAGLSTHRQAEALMVARNEQLLRGLDARDLGVALRVLRQLEAATEVTEIG